ncbi:hypothetical protein STEG23_002721, partial [Scotinomys teguina]
CCDVRENCYAQIKKVESCKIFVDHPLGRVYSYNCSESVVTCNEENDTCHDLICNCDRQTAACFFNASYNNNYNVNHC